MVLVGGFLVEFLLFIFGVALYISLPFCGGGNLLNLTEAFPSHLSVLILTKRCEWICTVAQKRKVSI